MSEELIEPPLSPSLGSESEEVHIPLTLKQKLWGFQGRISRAGYWGYMYSYYLLSCLPLILIYSCYAAADPETANVILFLILTVFSVIPSAWMGLALLVKRYHDRGKSGWWALISLIPYIGSVWVFIDAYCLAGNQGRNKYGDDPLLADGKTHQ